MRNKLFRVAFALMVLTLAVSGLALADATTGVESTPIPLSPKPNWSSMMFLLGTWHCSTQSSRRATPFVTTITYSLDSTGYWMIQKSVSPKVSWAPEVTSVDSITYDGTLHRWADVYTDDGGGYDVSFSPGWNGNTMVWTDAIFTPGPDVVWTSPTTNVKVSATKITSSNTFKEKSGRMVSVKGVCTKP